MADSRVILHADLDCFFAAVAVLDEPELAGKPVAVGGSPTGRGVVAACNYEARRYGVRSAMPMARAIRLCPSLVIRGGRYQRYRDLSDCVFDVFDRVSPLVQPLSIDEAFIDVTGSQRLLHGDGEAIARSIRETVLAETGLVVSIGVAPNKFVAKLASDLGKPDGLTVAPFEPGSLAEWLAPMPIRRMWGVGRVSEPKLLRKGFRTFADLQRASESHVRDVLGEHGVHWRELAFGRDDRPVHTDRGMAKSIGHETTFAEDIADRGELRATIATLADGVGARARRAGLVGRRVMVKLRHPDFRTHTRTRSLKDVTDSTDRIFATAWALLTANVPEGDALRLVGVTLQGIEPAAGKHRQRDMFAATADTGAEAVEEPSPDHEHNAVDDIIDRVRNVLGKDAIRRARDLPRGRKRNQHGA